MNIWSCSLPWQTSQCALLACLLLYVDSQCKVVSYINGQAVTKSYFGGRRVALYCSPGINLTSLSCGKMAFEVKVVKTKKKRKDVSYVSGIAAQPLTGRVVFSQALLHLSVSHCGVSMLVGHFFLFLGEESTEVPMMSSSVCAFL